MSYSRVVWSLLAVGALCLAQEGDTGEELTPYSVTEIDGYLHAFKTTYKGGAPEEDAVAVLADLKKAYRYIASKGEEADKDELKAQRKIVDMISKGLSARKRPLVTLECARVLGEIGDEDANRDLLRWMEKVLDDKNPNPQWVEYGFLSLAWIGAQDSRTIDFALKYATTGKHVDINVASQALRACYEWKALDGKDRKEMFNKIQGYLGGLWSSAKGGDPKKRATYDRRYKAVEENGLKALNELADGEHPKFTEPTKAMEWWKDNKSRRWGDYVGPKFRPKEAKPAEEGEKRDEEGGEEGGDETS